MKIEYFKHADDNREMQKDEIDIQSGRRRQRAATAASWSDRAILQCLSPVAQVSAERHGTGQ